eukprot:gene8934-10475_t
MIREILLTRRNKEEFFSEMFLREVFDIHGLSMGIMIVIRDITDAKRIQHSLEEVNHQLSLKSNVESQKNKELVEARDRALKAIQMKSQFMATISHEIRTPMNGVIGMAEMLLTSDLNPEQFEIADTIYKSGELLLSITSDILDFSKIEASRLELEMIEFDFIGCLEGTLNNLAVSLEKPIEISLLFEKDVPVKLIGDPNRFRQIVLNIGFNAIKYTEHGHIFTHVSVVERHSPKCKILVTIEDTGIGIPPEKIEQLFEPFSQLDSSTTRKYGGSGLGLAICSRLAKLMDGEVKLESSVPGQGSIFSISAIFEEVEPNNFPMFDPHPIDAPPMSLCILVDNYSFGSHVMVKKIEQIYNIKVLEFGSKQLEVALYQTPKGEHGQCNFVSKHLKSVMIVHREDDDLAQFTKFAEDTATFYQNTKVKVIYVTSFSNSKLVPKDRGFIHLTKPLSTINISKILTQEDILEGVRDRVRQLRSRSKKGLKRRPSDSSSPVVRVCELVDDHPGSPMQVSPPSQKRPACAGISNPTPPGQSPETVIPKILLVEDNAVNRSVISMQLKRLGYACDLAEDGKEGFEKYKNGTYDLIFMDLTMPVCDGAQSSLMIRSHEQITDRPRVRIIALSATVLDGSKEYCKSMGMDDFLIKPLKLSNLKSALDLHLFGKTS